MISTKIGMKQTRNGLILEKNILSLTKYPQLSKWFAQNLAVPSIYSSYIRAPAVARRMASADGMVSESTRKIAFFWGLMAQSERNCRFLRPDGAIRTKLPFLKAGWGIRTKFEKNRECRTWSEHIGTKFGNFVRTYYPIFWKFPSGLVTYNRGSYTILSSKAACLP
jgi:hypothetical protein